MHITGFSLGPIGTNCYMVSQDNHVLIIDPGDEASRLMSWLTDNELTPLAIFLTHAHFDHIGAVEELRNQYQIPVYLHAEESNWLPNPNLNRSVSFIGEEIKTREPDFLLNPGNLHLGPFEFEVLHTPGHSPGSVSFYWKEEKRIVSGDVLFNQGIGRTDLPGGDFEILKDSILQQLYQLSDDVTVYPGHGPTTTIGYEKKHNPFIRQI